MDGQLDFPDEVLQSLDYVSASIHTRLSPAARGDDRAHDCGRSRIRWSTRSTIPHGRIIRRREGYEVDMQAVIEQAAVSWLRAGAERHARSARPEWRLGAPRAGAGRPLHRQQRRALDQRARLHAVRHRQRPPRLADRRRRAQHRPVEELRALLNARRPRRTECSPSPVAECCSRARPVPVLPGYSRASEGHER